MNTRAHSSIREKTVLQGRADDRENVSNETITSGPPILHEMVPSYRYVSNQDKDKSNGYQLKQNGQVNYGPAANLKKDQQDRLEEHYGTKEGVLSRKDQYNKSHAAYVEAATKTGRKLTEQEVIAKRTEKNAPNASINHIIASGTGQNIMNQETLRFQNGKEKVVNPQSATTEEDRQKIILYGLAQQAAAVGRVQGYNRAIIDERHGEPLTDKTKAGKPNKIRAETNARIYGQQTDSTGYGELDAQKTRNKALRHTLTAFQGSEQTERHKAYRDVLKMTYDSPGNLRVGDSYGNNQASTGFDAPLGKEGNPTGRGTRLLKAHEAFAPDSLSSEDRVFSHASDGQRISSSQIIGEEDEEEKIEGKRKKRVSEVGGRKRVKSQW